jgi:hypothetical protein
VEYLEEHFGKSGVHYYSIVRGIHNKFGKTQPDVEIG